MDHTSNTARSSMESTSTNQGKDAEHYDPEDPEFVRQRAFSLLDRIHNDDASKTSMDSHNKYVDYTPSPEVKVLPPAKYKLWTIIFVLWYPALWAASEAEVREFLEFNGFLSPNASLVLLLVIIMFVMVYSCIDLFQKCLTFETKSGKVYGVIAWLKQPRAQWMYKHEENLLFELAASVVTILEEGFAMFNTPKPVQKELPQQMFMDCKDGSCQKTLKIEHRIKPDRLKCYNKWLLRVDKAVEQRDGVCIRDEIRKEWDKEEGTRLKNDDEGHRAYLALIYVKFQNINDLNDWMLSPRRKALMKQLEPLLAQADVVRIERNRDLPDAFSDLLTPQGNSVPKKAPRKWKVWWLTLLALYITVLWSNSFLPHYYDVWGVTSWMNPRLQELVRLFIVTFMNTYIMTPLLLFLFNHWVQHDDVKNKRQPWKALDRGFESIWSKAAITLAFYGGCIIAIIVKKHS